MGSREDDDYWNDKYDCDDEDCPCRDEDEAEDDEALITMMEIIDG